MLKEMCVGTLGEYYSMLEFYFLGAQSVERVDHAGIDLVVYSGKNYGVSVKTRDVLLHPNSSISLNYNDVVLCWEQAKIRGLIPAFAFCVIDEDGFHLLIVEHQLIFSHLCREIGREIGSIENYIERYENDQKHASLNVSIAPSKRRDFWPTLQGVPGVILVK